MTSVLSKTDSGGFVQEVKDFLDFVFGVLCVLRVDRLTHALVQVRLQDAQFHLVQCSGDGTHLGDDVQTVAALVNHPLHATYLPFDFLQPGQLFSVVWVFRVRAGGVGTVRGGLLDRGSLHQSFREEKGLLSGIRIAGSPERS
jgi:hypothetical protein